MRCGIVPVPSLAIASEDETIRGFFQIPKTRAFDLYGKHRSFAELQVIAIGPRKIFRPREHALFEQCARHIHRLKGEDRHGND
jgi:hypothetical protein